MKLYYSKGACSLAVRIMLHEMDIPCEFEAVDLKTKKTETGQNFLDINPKGAVPTLVLDDGTVLTENTAIQQYLADSVHALKFLPLVGDIERYRVLEWLSFVSSELHKGFGPLFNQDVPEQVKNDIFKPILKKRLAVAAKRLEKHTFLAGEHFTLPDAYLFVMLLWTPRMVAPLSEWPMLERYFKHMKVRKAVEHALKEEGIAV